MSNHWEVSCIDQRFDDEGFEIGRNAKTSSGKWVYEIYKQVFKHRADAERFAERLNKEIENGKTA